ncbi:uncharacterized protein LOC132742791 isoform X2 [Ruditapes philippinarum]|uniref:uncharacterized protein LOC132742791 isoform X2 n=1 Tax=Ruditapes philippinarum TaxID=129788 RepID=UPI00295AE7A4|nr:uncharacterized protein LOC132742791 isoform X2 [Ruditapes philippinarum]
MTTKLELQEELRKKQFQSRVLYERRRSSLGSEAKYNAGKITREQEKLRKQHQRLENAKQHNKEHSMLARDRRLSLPDDNLSGGPPPASSTILRTKSVHTPDYSKTKSRLFNYEKEATPRSKRQLMTSAQDNLIESPLSPQASAHSPTHTPLQPRSIPPMSALAMEARKASSIEIVKNVARLPQCIDGSEKPSKEQERSPSDVKVSFKEDDLFGRKASQGRVRRGSMPASLPKPLIQKRRASLPVPDIETPKPPSRARRHSMPANASTLPRISIDEAPSLGNNHDEDETRLVALYNKAIQTVQLADESILAGCLPFPNQLKERRFSHGSSFDRSSGSGFDLSTLKELESILTDARVYSKRKGSTEEYGCLDVAQKRAQKKRIEHLEQVLRKLNPTYDTSVDIDPMKVLQCSYLRLSKSNIETLENMLKQQGKDVGIHSHMDVEDYDIWKNLKEERVDLQKPPVAADEERRSSKTKRPIHI